MQCAWDPECRCEPRWRIYGRQICGDHAQAAWNDGKQREYEEQRELAARLPLGDRPVES